MYNWVLKYRKHIWEVYLYIPITRKLGGEIVNKDNFEMAFKGWLGAKHEVIANNRFFPENMESFYKLMDLICESSMLFIKPDTILYRARIIHDEKDLSNKEPFWGFNKESSFVPPVSATNNGRVNPMLIRYLYASSDEVTATMESRARIEDKISIAQIRCNKMLQIADLVYYEELEGVDECFRFMLAREFSAPTNKAKDYIFTQFVSEYIKSLGYDGIRYNSSLNLSGTNFTIFNWDKCEAISSSVYQVKSICMSIKPIRPQNKAQIKNKLKRFTKEHASFRPTVY